MVVLEEKGKGMNMGMDMQIGMRFCDLACCSRRIMYIYVVSGYGPMAPNSLLNACC